MPFLKPRVISYPILSNYGREKHFVHIKDLWQLFLWKNITIPMLWSRMWKFDQGWLWGVGYGFWHSHYEPPRVWLSYICLRKIAVHRCLLEMLAYKNLWRFCSHWACLTLSSLILLAIACTCCPHKTSGTGSISPQLLRVIRLHIPSVSNGEYFSPRLQRQIWTFPVVAGQGTETESKKPFPCVLNNPYAGS